MKEAALKLSLLPQLDVVLNPGTANASMMYKNGAITPMGLISDLEVSERSVIHMVRSFGKKNTLVDCGEDASASGGGCAGVGGPVPLNDRIGWKCRKTMVRSAQSRKMPSLGLCTPDEFGLNHKFYTNQDEVTCPENHIILSGGCFVKDVVQAPIEVTVNSITCDQNMQAQAVCAPIPQENSKFAFLEQVVEEDRGSALARCNTTEIDENEELHMGGGFCVGKDIVEMMPRPYTRAFSCRSGTKKGKIKAIARCIKVKKDLVPTSNTTVIPSSEDQATFEIRAVPGSVGSNGINGTLMLTSSIFLPMNKQVALAEIEEKHSTNLSLPTNVTVNFFCVTKGFARFTVMFHVELWDDGTTHRLPQKINFRIMKECPEIRKKSIKKVSLGLSIGTSQTTYDVMKDGGILPSFEINSTAPYTLGYQTVAIPLFITSNRKVTIYEVQAMSYKKDMLKVTPIILGGTPVDLSTNSKEKRKSSKKGLQLQKDSDPAVLSIRFHCHVKESILLENVTVGVVLTTDKGDVSFDFLKQCKEILRPEGWPIFGFNIATSEKLLKNNKPDVVKNGMTKQAYCFDSIQSLTTKLQDGSSRLDTSGERVFEDIPVMKFYFGMSHDIYKVHVHSVYVSEGYNALEPRVTVPMGMGIAEDQIVNKTVQSFSVKVICARQGLAYIGVRIPIVTQEASHLAVNPTASSFRFLYRCKKSIKPEEAKKVFNISGLHVDLSHAHRLFPVIKNGEISSYFFEPSNDKTKKRLVFPTNVEVARFIVNSDDENLRITGGAALSSHPQQMIVTTTHKDDRSRRKVIQSVRMRCLVTALITVTFVLHGQRKLEDGTIKLVRTSFHFQKMCMDEDSAPVNTQGGVSIPGFVISTEENKAKVVVRNGYPTKFYFGHTKGESSTLISRIKVPSKHSETTFRISYDPEAIILESLEECVKRECMNAPMSCYDGVDDCNCYNLCKTWSETVDLSEGATSESVELDPPNIFKHDGISAPVLIGSAKEGVKLSPARKTAEFGIQWNCLTRGETWVTVRIPVLGEGYIAFTVPKQCDGARKNKKGVFLQGLTIVDFKPKDTKIPRGGNVVTNGIVQGRWIPGVGRYNPEPVPPEDNTSFFYVYRFPLEGFKIKGGEVDGVEGKDEGSISSSITEIPLAAVWAFSHRPICNPEVTTDIPNARLNSTDTETKTSLTVDGMPVYSLNVTYNCIWVGSTTITVVMAVKGGGHIVFSYSKICFEDELEKLSPIENCISWETDTTDAAGSDENSISEGVLNLASCSECAPGYDLKTINGSDTCIREEDNYEGEAEDSDDVKEDIDTFFEEDDDFSNFGVEEEIARGRRQFVSSGKDFRRYALENADEEDFEIGSISVATDIYCLEDQEACNVINNGIVQTDFNIMQSYDKTIDTGKLMSEVVPNDKDSSIFWIVLPEGTNAVQLGYPSVQTRRLGSKGKICKPTLEGKGSRESVLQGDTNAFLFK
eukprot:CAMPEP_0167744726 /NCGR_PEP_ID=MMETSP0110_2-20121227/2751_1 /TAXON_ID=629695 /ORGANISM="Gymnochlora sp., Strain CCMP2014" /LENGTH=1464 /DNA_ID=CAMNT_0007629279 /DNA_START=57 /DNA_END=4452 /DNA_ORIENTATION=+